MKKGMKTMFGKRVPNCVKKEEQELPERLVKLDKKGPKNLKKLDKLSKYEKRKAALAQQDDINEGPNDPAIFKAVFTAGGPGAGKSFVVVTSGAIALGQKYLKIKK